MPSTMTAGMQGRVRIHHLAYTPAGHVYAEVERVVPAMYTNYVTGTSRHWLLTKWWMRTRPCIPAVMVEGIGGASEFYCPRWAIPLDLIHAALFGRVKLVG